MAYTFIILQFMVPKYFNHCSRLTLHSIFIHLLCENDSTHPLGWSSGCQDNHISPMWIEAPRPALSIRTQFLMMHVLILPPSFLVIVPQWCLGRFPNADGYGTLNVFVGSVGKTWINKTYALDFENLVAYGLDSWKIKLQALWNMVS